MVDRMDSNANGFDSDADMPMDIEDQEDIEDLEDQEDLENEDDDNLVVSFFINFRNQ